MPSHKTRTNAAAVAVSLFALASSAKGAVVCHPSPPIPVPVTTAGVYINLVTGVSATTPAGAVGWDINPWGASSINFWFNNGANPSPGGATLTAGVIDVFSSGASIGPANTYSGTTPSAGNMAGWRAPNSGKYLGVRLYNEGTAAINYGWMQIDTVAPATGLPATVQSWCYENTGVAITAGTTPVELETFTVE